MGVVENMRWDQYPKQSEHVGKPVEVVFNYDLDHKFYGVVVRDDIEAPWVTIFSLEDTRIVLATECQYSYKKE